MFLWRRVRSLCRFSRGKLAIIWWNVSERLVLDATHPVAGSEFRISDVLKARRGWKGSSRGNLIERREPRGVQFASINVCRVTANERASEHIGRASHRISIPANRSNRDTRGDRDDAGARKGRRNPSHPSRRVNTRQPDRMRNVSPTTYLTSRPSCNFSGLRVSLVSLGSTSGRTIASILVDVGRELISRAKGVGSRLAAAVPHPPRRTVDIKTAVRQINAVNGDDAWASTVVRRDDERLPLDGRDRPASRVALSSSCSTAAAF